MMAFRCCCRRNRCCRRDSTDTTASTDVVPATTTKNFRHCQQPVIAVAILIVVATTIIALSTTSCVRIEAFTIPWLLQPQRHDARKTATTTRTRRMTLHSKKPQRLEENVDGVVYVNDRCINCAACSGFAPHIFRRGNSNNEHVVYEQPKTISDIEMTRAALAACPVAAIRIETTAERNHQHNVITFQNTHDVLREDPPPLVWSDQDAWTVQQMTSKDRKRPFPRPFLLNESDTATTSQSPPAVPDVYWVGHHNEASFGAIPYLVKAIDEHQEQVWIMVDTPKFNVQSVRDVTSITGPHGPHYLFMTHVDDTADHNKWANHFNATTTTATGKEQLYCQRIFHSGDLGPYNWIGDTSLEDVPILLTSPKTPASYPDGFVAYTLNGTCISNSSNNNTKWLHDFESGQLNTNVLILHTPGHSPGSCTLYKRRQHVIVNATTTTTIPGILFTGDTYGYTGTTMTGFPRYGHDMDTLNHTLSLFLTQLSSSDDTGGDGGWDIIAPGHAHARDYRTLSHNAVRMAELEQAQADLFAFRRRRQ